MLRSYHAWHPVGEPIGLMLEPPAWRENPLDQGWLYRWQKMTPQGWLDMDDIEAVEIEKEVELAVYIDEQRWEF